MWWARAEDWTRCCSGNPSRTPARSPRELHHHARAPGTTGPWAVHTAGVQMAQFGVASMTTLHDLGAAPNERLPVLQADRRRGQSVTRHRLGESPDRRRVLARLR